MNKLFSCGQSYCDIFYIFILYFKHAVIVFYVFNEGGDEHCSSSQIFKVQVSAD
jgi:hypothetical protein